ncbi:carboxypeptidase-like regulatory domain-containing protein, partial [Bacteroides heparinolyticus]|uniref:carboxypeptidase-like regulatory domain-containing protein n=1 Tax=Prevotella heparinolytica TaxID=28113 RepID=UPI00359F9238
MNEDRKKRGTAHSKFLTAVAISALFLSSGNAMANPNTSTEVARVTEQLQTITVRGLIVDAAGEPVIGASVVEKGTSNGIVTDLDGKFTLNVKPGATLKVSFVGYQPQEVKATSTMKIVLKEDTELLDEVVVVGYGTQKKGNLTGAVATVDIGKTLDGRPIADVGRGLQGSTPGLSITLPDAEVGSDPKIKIRGQYASMNGGSDPLILLDNVEIPSITLVNPDDIESISVLKDAAASSIYGAKAAFGVILITTKKGAKTEMVNVSYSGNFSWQNVAKDYNMGGIEGMQYTVDAMKNAGATAVGAFYKVTEEGLAKAREWEQKYGGKLGVNDPTVYGRDWYLNAAGQKIGLRSYDAYDYMVRDWAPTQSHNISVNGKSGKTTYNIGLGYLDQSGMNKVAKEDKFWRNRNVLSE